MIRGQQKWIIVGGVLIALGIGISFWNFAQKLRTSNKEGGDVRIVTAQTGNIVDVIKFRGMVVAAKRVPVSSEASGQVVKLYIRQGDRVVKGQKLLEIDPTQLQGKVETQKLLMEKSEITMRNSGKEYERAKALFKENLITESQLADFKKAEDLSKVDYELAKKQLDLYSDQLGKVVILAPISGVITSKNVEEGEVVASTVEGNTGGKVLLTITDDTNKSIEAMVSDVERADLTNNQPVTLWLDIAPEKRLSGKVSKIDSAATGIDTNKPSSDTNTKVSANQFRVEIDIPENYENFVLGGSVNIEAPVREARNVLLVPLEAVFRDDQHAWVYVITRAGYEKRGVSTGISNVDSVEIKLGLKAGEKVSLDEPDQKN